jgi:serine phosphatase RsbU (regulator of sigma subunit)
MQEPGCQLAKHRPRTGNVAFDHVMLIGEDGLVLHPSPSAPALDLSSRCGPSAPWGMRTILGSQPGGQAIGSSGAITEGGPGASTAHQEPWTGATDQTREEEELPAEARSLGAAAQAAAVLDSSLDAQTVLAHVVEYACLLFDVPSAAVLMPGPSGAYVVGAQTGLGRPIEEKGISAEVVEQLGFDVPVPLFIPDLSPLRAVPYFDELAVQGFAGALSLALATDSGLEGILLLQDRRSLHLKMIDLEALKILATHAACALRNAEHYRLERSTAEVLRRTILALPDAVPGIAFAHCYVSATRSAAVGGDFYDVFPCPDGQIALVIGDVSGKGLPAAATAVLARDAVKAYAHLDPSPASVLERVNSLLCRTYSGAIFVTLGYFLLEPRTGRLEYGLAGHPPALLKRARGGVEVLEQHASPLGVFVDQTYRQDLARLEPPDMLVLYTDGVTETRRGRYLFGERRLSLVVEKAEQDPVCLVEKLAHAVEVYGRGDFRDDAGILAVLLKPDPSAAEP